MSVDVDTFFIFQMTLEKDLAPHNARELKRTD